jgi:hypothetical protein
MNRPAVFVAMELQLCDSVRVFFELPLRQAVGMLRALLKVACLLNCAGQFNPTLTPEDVLRPISLTPSL